MRRVSGSIWACALIMVAAACIGITGSAAFAQTDSLGDISSENETPPSPPTQALQIAGTWDGAIQDSNQGPGTISLTFTQSQGKEGSLQGSWTINFPSAPIRGAINDAGTLTGSVTNTDISVTLHPRPGAALGKCELVFKSDSASVDGISGSYQFGVCGESNSGMIAIAPRPASDVVLINIGDDFFFPRKVKISKGQTVRWTNNGAEDHTVSAHPGPDCVPSRETFDSGTLKPGATYERTFNNAGTFPYHCEIHGCRMKGKIKVK